MAAAHFLFSTLKAIFISQDHFMRKLIFLLQTSRCLVAALIITCIASSSGYSQQLVDSAAQRGFAPNAAKSREVSKTGSSTYIGGRNKKPNTIIHVVESADGSDDAIGWNPADDADSLDKESASANHMRMLDAVKKRVLSTSGNIDSSVFKISSAVLDVRVDLLIQKYSEMIATAPEEFNNYSLYRFIDQWYGTRYKWGGNDNSGIDCSAFSQKLYGAIYNVNILRTARQQRRNCDYIEDYDDANEGDLVFFRIRRLRVSHVGVYLANGYFVHASRSHGVVISNLEDRYWQRRYAGCGHVAREEKSRESDYLQ